MGERKRSYRWEDPRPVWATIGTISGLEFLQREINGEAPPPPICVSMGFCLLSASPREVIYEGRPGEDHYNAVGMVQGGWVASLLDAALGSVIFAALPRNCRYTTLELKANYLRPVTLEAGPMTCTARLDYLDEQKGSSQARITGA